ncbi:Plasmodium exported protein, unknown function [Plasmodium gonderi]|uniref:Uncharacterized protein n=1 Tax=Plasmodium gonderi TaxID=77519 RepID=A0A1Y1JD16_PLAGO|nr:Plasmodium exported protein, unknown function [Plasmodium gonderi]GAW80421.1 Plasmodium exported protein, unknown function [Plasmodium gonderi]
MKIENSMGIIKNKNFICQTILKLAVISLLFFCVFNEQNHGLKDESKGMDLNEKNKKWNWRVLSELEEGKNKENTKHTNNQDWLDKLWKKEMEKWKSDVYLINKETFWEFKRVCLINNVNFKWENEMWKNFRDQMSKNILAKEKSDHEDFIAFKNKKPTKGEYNEFILAKRKTFSIFYDTLVNERSKLIDHVIKEWMNFRSQVFDKMEHKVLKVRKVLKKMKKKDIAKLYS